ncbi:HupE/UreJ family protein [Congregibacter sp.]|uniref:HupE/UreJ family protein n=1 Tax=Congregibacter sp. TaxID=2744308 RepID=UPI003F6A978A
MRTGLFLALLLVAVSANSHLLNMSRSSVSVAADGSVTVDLSLDLLATARSRESYWSWSQQSAPLADGAIQQALAPLPEAVALTANGEQVTLSIEDVRFPDASREEFLDPLGWPRTEVTLKGQLPVTRSTPLTLEVSYLDSFRFEEPIANTLIDERGERRQTRWLVTGQRSPQFQIMGTGSPAQETPFTARVQSEDRSAEARAVFADLLLTGFRHIFPDGIDHLLFVAALFFGSASIAGLVGIITLFTLAHSLSLGMTALGWFSAPATVVEPLILLSSLWIAVANLLGHGRTHTRYPLVLFFGLIHGLGFAAALREIGLPGEFILTGLLAFNLGVEAAQLAFLFVLSVLALLVTQSLSGLSRWRRGGSFVVILATLGIAGARFL